MPEILDFRRQKDAGQLEASLTVSPRLACLSEQELEDLLKGELEIKNPKSNFKGNLKLLLASNDYVDFGKANTTPMKSILITCTVSKLLKSRSWLI